MSDRDRAAVRAALGHKRVVVDLDGTLLKNAWPELGELQPGAVDAMRRFRDAGLEVVVHSCRLSPLMPDHRTKRHHAVVQSEINKVRAFLDEHGLTFVDIYTGSGKPSGQVYIDDKAERYHGRPGSWRAMTQKVLMRLGLEDD